MKKEYIVAELNVIKFNVEEIITGSNDLPLDPMD